MRERPRVPPISWKVTNVPDVIPAFCVETTEIAAIVVGLQIKLYPNPKRRIVTKMNGIVEDAVKKV